MNVQCSCGKVQLSTFTTCVHCGRALTDAPAVAAPAWSPPATAPPLLLTLSLYKLGLLILSLLAVVVIFGVGLNVVLTALGILSD